VIFDTTPQLRGCVVFHIVRKFLPYVFASDFQNVHGFSVARDSVTARASSSDAERQQK
jgi:hypothetical protein